MKKLKISIHSNLYSIHSSSLRVCRLKYRDWEYEEIINSTSGPYLFPLNKILLYQRFFSLHYPFHYCQSIIFRTCISFILAICFLTENDYSVLHLNFVHDGSEEGNQGTGGFTQDNQGNEGSIEVNTLHRFRSH